LALGGIGVLGIAVVTFAGGTCSGGPPPRAAVGGGAPSPAPPPPPSSPPAPPSLDGSAPLAQGALDAGQVDADGPAAAPETAAVVESDAAPLAEVAPSPGPAAPTGGARPSPGASPPRGGTRRPRADAGRSGSGRPASSEPDYAGPASFSGVGRDGESPDQPDLPPASFNQVGLDEQ